jgi:hypothetical protein
VNTFLDNAQRIFDVARQDSCAENSDFALLVRSDGSLHLIMESAVSLETASLEAAAIHAGARTAYHVSRSTGGVRVTGLDSTQRCVIEDLSIRRRSELLRDQPLYSITSPLPTSASSRCVADWPVAASAIRCEYNGALANAMPQST